jgi:hypothetical protein
VRISPWARGLAGAYGVVRSVPCRDANFGYHRSVLSQTFIPKSKDTSKVVKIRDGADVAARYFVYKLYEATDGQPPLALEGRGIRTPGGHATWRKVTCAMPR